MVLFLFIFYLISILRLSLIYIEGRTINLKHAVLVEEGVIVPGSLERL